MLLIGLRLLVQRTVAHVLHAQGAGDDQHLIEGSALSGLQQHAPDTRVQRQLGQQLTDRRELIGLVHRTEFGQQLVAVGNGPTLRRLDEGKVFDRPQVQCLHPQDDRGQRAAQDFRVGKARPTVEVLLVVEADTDALGHPAAAARALIGRRLRNRLDQQLLDLAAKAVTFDAGGAAVDHIADARDG